MGVQGRGAGFSNRRSVDPESPRAGGSSQGGMFGGGSSRGGECEAEMGQDSEGRMEGG